jgi:uncharacterized protein (TIGR02757 family)
MKARAADPPRCVRSCNPHAVRLVLERVVEQCDVAQRLARDPVGLVRQFDDDADRELVGLIAALLAFGNVTALRASIQKVIARLGPRLRDVLDDPLTARDRLRGVGHRMVRDVDIWRLLVGARSMQRTHGGLGVGMGKHMAQSGGRLRSALSGWAAELRETSGLHPERSRRGPQHILPDPAGPSSCKRLLLYLRWMVRRDDGVDMGLWHELQPSQLIIPLDTHIFRLARNLGWTARASPSWTAAEQITDALRAIDARDPVRFDFALCHMGMVQACPSRRDKLVCPGCAVQPLCRHWAASRFVHPGRDIVEHACDS